MKTLPISLKNIAKKLILTIVAKKVVIIKGDP